MKYIKQAAIIILLFFLCGCGHSVSEGIIIEKQHKKAYTSIIPVTHIVGKSTITTMTPIYHGERWLIKIQKCVNDGCKESVYDVDEKEFWLLNKGNYWRYEE